MSSFICCSSQTVVVTIKSDSIASVTFNATVVEGLDQTLQKILASLT